MAKFYTLSQKVLKFQSCGGGRFPILSGPVCYGQSVSVIDSLCLLMTAYVCHGQSVSVMQSQVAHI